MKSDHSKALVPIDTWAYSAPELHATGRNIDLGQLAETLLYYDQVLVSVATPQLLAEVVEWFICQDRFETLLALLRDGTLQVYEYSFHTGPVNRPDGRFELWHLKGPQQDMPNSFEERWIQSGEFSQRIPSAEVKKLSEALRGRVIEAKADAFSLVISEAAKDFLDPERNKLTMQAFVDELYGFRNLGRPPTVIGNAPRSVAGKSVFGLGAFGGSDVQIYDIPNYNVDPAELASLAGPTFVFRSDSPMIGHCYASKYLLSAARLSCDLFLARPMSVLVGDKLYESAQLTKPSEIIETLQRKVEFPDVRALVNDGRLSVDDILEIRKKAVRFRQWLQSEGDRDRDALVAYHDELARTSGWKAAAPRLLKLFGVIGGTAVGGALGGSLGGAAGSALGGALTYTMDLAEKMNEAWRPVLFGDWMKDRISQLDKGRG